jgi:hypothetical protein
MHDSHDWQECKAITLRVLNAIGGHEPPAVAVELYTVGQGSATFRTVARQVGLFMLDLYREKRPDAPLPQANPVSVGEDTIRRVYAKNFGERSDLA